MRILVIPDIHLKPHIFDEADKVNKTRYDNIVCLGDLIDEWNQQYKVYSYENTLQKVLEFDKKHPKMLWCWGNHDLSYKFLFEESGFSYVAIDTVRKYLQLMEKQFGKRLKVIHKIDNTLFSHAGLTHDYTDEICKADHNNLAKIMNRINAMAKDEVLARKLWRNDSPIWIRPPSREDEHWLPFWFGKDKYFQIVGHTPVKEPTQIWNTLILDTFSLRSDLQPIGDQKLVIVDTIENKWEYVEE